MAKGNRQRANKSPAKSTKPRPKPLVTRDTLLKNYPIRTLNNSDVSRFKEMVTLSNNVASLLKQCVDTDMSIEKGGDVAKQMLSGKIKGPAMQKITSNLYLPLVDMKDVATKIKNEVGMLSEANKISKKQLSQRYDEYIDSMRNLRTMLDQLLAQAPKKDLAKIRGDRTAIKSGEAEQILFEKEVSKLTAEDKDYIKSIKTKIDEKAKEHSSACECKSCKLQDEKAKEVPKLPKEITPEEYAQIHKKALPKKK